MLVKPEVEKLLINCGNSHKLVASETVPRWIKD